MQQQLQTALFLALFATSAAALQSPVLLPSEFYSIQDPTAAIDNIQQSWGMAINESGRVTGSFRGDDWKRSKVFVWQDGQIVDIVIPQPTSAGNLPPTLPAVHRLLRATDINDAGVVVGDARHYSFGVAYFGFFTSTPSSAPYPPLAYSASMANYWTHGVSNTDPMLVVGMGIFNGSKFEKRGLVQQVSESTGPVGSPISISPFGDKYRRSAAQAVNDNGLVVGWAERQNSFARAFVWDYATQTKTDLGTLGGPSSEATDINALGQIVGSADRSDGRSHAFLYRTTMRDLGTLGGNSSSAQGINDRGQTVGSSWTVDGKVHAFLYSNGVMYDLNDLVLPDTGWVLQYAQDINARGQIVGWGRLRGETRAFVLTKSSRSTF